ncbi:MAG: hypothetical protein COB74_05195 [Shewanella sp.]|nr:MAG: hypothetical protein COB74_05195 [Shewanella sp.]
MFELSSLSISQYGLLMDIFAAIIIMFSGLPSGLLSNGQKVITEIPTKESLRKAKLLNRLSHFGLVLLCVGFIFQFANSF